MFCGKPIVITDLEWSHELLSDCNCLALIKVRDPNDLTSKLEKIINEPDYSKMLSRNSINNVHKYFNYEKKWKVLC
jgi:glycosyltransferase involved in cell wall biosynthesis